MTKYRNDLPQLSDDLFLTDGGIETTLIFHDGFDLPEFAAFDLLKDEDGIAALNRYFRTYAMLAKKYRVGFIFESPTWRASADWGAKLGYSSLDLAEKNKQAIALLDNLRFELEDDEDSKMVISGCIGPRDDGYNPSAFMSVQQAENYHRDQIATFSDTSADMVTAITMTYIEEAMGISHAAQSLGMPVAISFTVETDGRLPSGQNLKEAIQQIDEETAFYPAYYMINCAHPNHFEDVLSEEASCLDRIRGLRANASTLSHEELDESEELDDGNPDELAKQYKNMRSLLTNLNVFGGCCGTDHRHIEAIYLNIVED
jgi:S-methylmethionine-dependent homocysteine/selenocysteine methylase